MVKTTEEITKIDKLARVLRGKEANLAIHERKRLANNSTNMTG
jgi:hypothetical protein